MVPYEIKYLTVSQNEDLTYNVVYIADLLDGDYLYTNCEIITPRVAVIDDGLLSFPFYDKDGDSMITITIPENVYGELYN